MYRWEQFSIVSSHPPHQPHPESTDKVYLISLFSYVVLYLSLSKRLITLLLSFSSPCQITWTLRLGPGAEQLVTYTVNYHSF